MYYLDGASNKLVFQRLFCMQLLIMFDDKAPNDPRISGWKPRLAILVNASMNVAAVNRCLSPYEGIAAYTVHTNP